MPTTPAHPSSNKDTPTMWPLLTKRPMRVIPLAFTFALVVGIAAPANAASGFGDVEPDQWYTDGVAWMVDQGITTGTEPGCFSPTNQVTRGQIVTFLHRLELTNGATPSTSDHPFVDVTASYQQDPVAWAFANGITTGTSATTFSPNAPIYRGDFAAMLWRYAGEPSGAPTHPFVDVTREYRQRPVSWMFAEQITTGTSDTTFNPWGLMTRAEAATFLHRYVGSPAVSATTLAEEVYCAKALRDALITAGLTPTEAECAAPVLSHIEPETVLALADGSLSPDGTMLDSVSEVLAAGCISMSRWSALTRIFL